MIPYRDDGIHLHLASTPRHIISAFAIASNLPKAQHHLIIFDQPLTKNDFVESVLEHNEQSSLFCSSLLLHKKSKTNHSKAKHRKQLFVTLSKFIEDTPPNVLYVGNDRRLEFQYLAQKLENQSHNIYVDEGTGSYNNFFGISKVKSFFDKHIDTRVKKLAYGNWFDRPAVLGDSKWIHSSILCFPSLANYALAKKSILEFNSEWILKPELSDLLSAYARKLNININEFQKIQCLYTLPHSSFIESCDFDIEAYRNKIIKEIENGEHCVGFKYHPRQEGDPLKLQELSAIEIPRQLPLEIFLPIMRLDKALGDISSALMSVKWQSPNASVIASKYNNSPAVNQLLEQFKHIGIKCT